jgi:hypothetical protein
MLIVVRESWLCKGAELVSREAEKTSGPEAGNIWGPGALVRCKGEGTAG